MIDLFPSLIQKMLVFAASLMLFFGIGVPIIPEKESSVYNKPQAGIEDGALNALPGAQNENILSGTAEGEAVGRDKAPEPEKEISEAEPQPAPTSEQIALVNKEARSALVNVFCLSRGVGVLEPVSGSGVIIDPRGVVLTNAHVAQYLLLKDYPQRGFVECILRNGSPAKPAYEVELLYISPRWVKENAYKLKIESPRSSGKNDFAFLLIKGPVPGSEAPPERFPFLPVEESYTALEKGHPVLLASYPAGFIGGKEITRSLWITTSVTSISNLFTFNELGSYNADTIEVPGTIGAQEGSSGGGIVSLKSGRLLGLIAIRTEGATTGERTLRALTLPYINATLLEENIDGINELLKGNLLEKARVFGEVIAPSLTNILEEELTRQ